MPFPTLVDHATKALDRILSQYKEKPRFEALLRSYLAPFEELEQVFFDIAESFTIEGAAEGSHALKKLARIVGATSYKKVRVYTQIRANRSSGRIKDFGDILALLGVTAEQWQWRAGTKWVEIDVYLDSAPGLPSPLSADFFYLGKLMQSVKAGGERLVFGYSGEDFFGFDGNPASQGYGSIYDASVGGHMAGLIT